MFSRLTRPFRRRYSKYADKVSGFVVPVKDAVDNIMDYIPGTKGFAGSEEISDDSGKSNLGIFSRFKKFKNSLKGLSDFQKLVLLTIVVCLPAGIIVAVFLANVIKARK